MTSKYSVYYCGSVYGLEPVGPGWIVSEQRRDGSKVYIMLTRRPAVWWDRIPHIWWTKDRTRARVYSRRTATKHLSQIVGTLAGLD